MESTINRAALTGIYARLKGLDLSIPARGGIPASAARDYNSLVKQLADVLGENTSSFECGRDGFYSNGEYCHLDVLRPKLGQLISYLDYVHHISNEVIEVGSLYNSIQDSELRGRCADLLSAPGNFDRVINQATQVLEDRIRRKAEKDGSLTGTQLVNEVLKGDLARTVLKVSEDEGEQRGIADICRGIMFAFRNPTHHQVSNKFTREQALKVCAFVDNLLVIVGNASVLKQNSV